MLICKTLSEIPQDKRGGIVCIGNFDGVHLGHAAMLDTARRTAESLNLPMLVITFDPHPLAILRPDISRPYISTIDQRLKLIGRFEPDAVWLITPDREFLNISRETFEQDILNRQLHARHLVEGRSFTYGRGALGNIQTLRESGATSGWEVIEIPTGQAVLSDFTLVDISSSLVRWLISHGRVRDAAVLLGRPYTLSGRVIHGRGRGGSVLGYPTINLASDQLIPADGVYAGAAMIEDRRFPAAVSVGTNPTFGNGERTVEAFLLDCNDTFYDCHVELAITHWLRDQERFPSLELLIRQIGRDVACVRRLTHSAVSDGTIGPAEVSTTGAQA